MEQLKKALLKAGLASSDQLHEQHKIKERPRKEHVKLDKEREGHTMRTQCEHCDRFAPDVEYYEHRIGILAGKKWLCMKCADTHCISDDVRHTAQSTQARGKRFLREYGHTKKGPL